MRGNLSNDIVSVKIEEGSKKPIALNEKSFFGKIEADQLFKSYSTLRNKNEISSEELKLLHLVKAEINFLKS